MTATSYRGVPAQMMPTDAWVYQEIIHELQPDYVIEVGNCYGGSLLYLADLCEWIGHGRVIGVDIDHAQIISERVRVHPRITLVEGDAVEVFPIVDDLVDGEALVIEDSDHTVENTLAVMEAYSKLVPKGGYLIVEDGVMPTVAEAIRLFRAKHVTTFAVDTGREWPVTWNPNGYLRRLK